jgi:hypothetical protein
MMGVAFLNEIVIKLKNLNAGQILDNLRENVKNSLHQNNQNSNSLKNELTVKDGMDISLCIFDNNTYELQFAGANNPIYVINTPVSLSVPDSYRDEDKGAAGLNHTSTPCLPDRQALSVTKNLVELKGDKMPIGIHVGIERPFVTNYIKAEKGAKFYLFSDGYADQFGGPLGKKFMYSRLKQLLLDISNKPLDQQCTILEHTIEKWMADVEQIDDILIIGIEIV